MYRTSNDINIGPVTKLDKKNTKMSKKFDDEVMSVNCDVIMIFPIYGQFGAIRKQDFRRMALQFTFYFILQKLKGLSKGFIFDQKC